jgi:hypothetical protein
MPMPRTELELYLAMRALIASPERWTRHVDARDAKGRETGALDSDAVCWCLDGARMRIWYGPHGQPSTRATVKIPLAIARLIPPMQADGLREACQTLFGTRIIGAANDAADHAGALAICDLAIARLSPPMSAE